MLDMSLSIRGDFRPTQLFMNLSNFGTVECHALSEISIRLNESQIDVIDINNVNILWLEMEFLGTRGMFENIKIEI